MFSELGDKRKLDSLLIKLKQELKLELPTIFMGDRILFFFKSESDTVLDLIDGIIYKNIKQFDEKYGVSKDSVFSIIASITHQITGVPRIAITPSARFVDDLGVS